MIQIQYRFNYHHEKDMVEVIFLINSQGLTLGLPYDVFLSLIDDIIKTTKPFLDDLKRRKEMGIEGDIKVEFDVAKWNKMMEEKNA